MGRGRGWVSFPDDTFSNLRKKNNTVAKEKISLLEKMRLEKDKNKEKEDLFL